MQIKTLRIKVFLVFIQRFKKGVQVFVFIEVYYVALFNFYSVSFLWSQSKSFFCIFTAEPQNRIKKKIRSYNTVLHQEAFLAQTVLSVPCLKLPVRVRKKKGGGRHAFIIFKCPHSWRTIGTFEKLKSITLFNMLTPFSMSVAENIFQEFVGHKYIFFF